MKPLVFFLIALYSINYSVNALAQSLTKTEAIDEIAVIATRVVTPVNELPANISLLDSDSLNRISAVHIQQVLSRVPGINLQRGNGQESLPSIRSPVLTGAGACGSFLVMEDSIPVRGFGFCNVNELFDTHFEQAQRIEVARGANTAFYGSNALNGSINIVLPETGDNQLSLALGSNQFIRLKNRHFYSLGNASGNVHISLSDDGGYRDDSGYNQQKISWRHRANIGNWNSNTGLTYTRLDQQTAGFIVGRNSFKSETLSQQNLDSEAFRDTQSFRLWSHLSKPLNGKVELKVSPYIRYTDMDFLLHFLPGDPLEQNSQWGAGWQSSIAFDASDYFNWNIGADFDYSQGALSQTQANPTQGSAFLQETTPTGVHYDYDVDATQFALFGFANWSISNSLTLLGGLRWELNQYDYDNLSLTGRTRDDGAACGFGGCRYSRPADRDDSFNEWSPTLELQYSYSEQVAFHLALKRGFRAPQATELYRLQRQQQVADLDSVTLSSIDIGANIAYPSGVIDIVFYANELNNVIIRDSAFLNVDGNQTRSRGLELQINHQLAKHWSFDVTANWARHQYTSDQIVIDINDNDVNINGNDVDTAPRFFGNAQLRWDKEKWRTELDVFHTSGYYLNAENTSDYSGHTLINASIHYQLNQQWSLFLRLNNIANRRYAERADFTNFTQERYFPGEPLSALFKVSYLY